MPRVSVVIPAHNSGDLVGRAIESVLAQTYQDFEVVVVDDASSDHTAEAVSRYLGRVRYLRRDAQGGAAAARNDGILATTGEYVCFLDADDLYLPGRLEGAVVFLDQHPECGAVFADCEVRDPNDAVLVSSMVDASGCWRGPITWRDVACFEPMHTNTMTIRRVCLEEVGLFDLRLRRGQDSELWLRLSYRFRIGRLPDVLAVFYLRNRRRSASEIARRIIPVWRVVLEWLDDAPPADRRFAHSRVARAHWLLAFTLRSEGKPSARDARDRAVAHCLQHTLVLPLIGGMAIWHFSPVVRPVLAALRRISWVGRRALMAMGR
jgi:glycosyltransferase involved in cell wall biosynthesis